MLAAIGDLAEDVVVSVVSPLHVASDTDAVIVRRRGGSAANVAAVAARVVGRSRFLGQVGHDPLGEMLVAALATEGVDVACVRHGGRSATIAVLVDAGGERTMLVDRGSVRELCDPDPAWLDGVDALHIPFYSLAVEPIAGTARTLAAWCREGAIDVAIDVSSVAVLTDFGLGAARAAIAELRPSAVFANADEAALLAVDAALGEALTFVKRGADPALVFVPGQDAPLVVPALALPPESAHLDTTGAGDAFAAGVLTAPGWRDDPRAACEAGHRAAHALLVGR